MTVTTVSLASRQKATLGIYFHIPFCPHLCPYCDFVKTDMFTRSDAVSYFSWMKEELLRHLDRPGIQQHRVVTVYFGGGTPGIFWGSAFEPLLKVISARFEIEECTLECNPGLVSQAKIQSWSDVGVNRLTLGAQALDPLVLNFLGRKHTEIEVANAVAWARASRLENIQMDVIYGLPRTFQNRKLGEELDRMVAMGVTGFSTYALTIEEKTSFGAAGVCGDDDLAVDEYDVIRRCASVHGFVRRETSNFSQFECKHNNLYWYGFPYLGIGAGAHGLLDEGMAPGALFGERYHYGPLSNSSERRQTVTGRDDLQIRSDSSPWQDCRSEGPRTWQEMFQEMTFALLRTPAGIPGHWIAAQPESLSSERLLEHPHLASGFAAQRIFLDSDGTIRLSPEEHLMGDHWHRMILSAWGVL